MERMDEVGEMLREMSEKYKNSKSVEVYEEQLEGWFKIIDDLREENKKMKKNAMEDTREITKLEMKVKMLMDELQEVYRQNVRIKKDLAMYQRLRDQLFGGLEEEDLYEDIK